MKNFSWKELLSVFRRELPALAFRIEESISFIKEHEPEEGYFLGFSGGKDSIVLYHLASASHVRFKAFYTATGIDPPCVVRFIKKYYPDVIFLRPKEPFFKLVAKKGPPTLVNRWCCDALKKKPAAVVPLTNRLLGIRAEESPKRRKRGMIDFYKGEVHLHPIFNWTSDDVWNFIRILKLPYPLIYEEGFERVGCTICPIQNQKRFELSQKRFPGFFYAFKKAAERFWLSSPAVRKRASSFEELWNYYLKNRSLPSKINKGGLNEAGGV